MSESKFTSGPWEADETTVKTGRNTIAAVYDPDDTCHRTSIGLANARLIAAAPDMYEKIEAALKEWAILPHDRPYKIEEITDWLVRFMAPAMEELRAAIAKTGGRNE